MSNSAFTKSAIAALFAASALLVLAGTPALADVQVPNTVEAAHKYIDQLANEVYRPGNARKANEDLKEACSQLYKLKQAQLNEDWASAYYHCRRALTLMRSYNTGGTADWSPPVSVKVSRLEPSEPDTIVAVPTGPKIVAVPSEPDTIAVLPPVVIELPGRLHDRDVRRDEFRKDLPGRSEDKGVKAETVRPHSANRPVESATRSAGTTRTAGLAHTSGPGPARMGNLGATHGTRLGSVGAARMGSLGASHMGGLGGMHASHFGGLGAAHMTPHMGGLGGARMSSLGGGGHRR